MRRTVSLIFVLLGLVLGFQNCQKLSPQVNFSQNEKQDSDSGHPYEGKTFVALGGLCPDQSNVQAKIILSSQDAGALVRESCQNLEVPVALTSKDFQMDPLNINKLTYKNILFQIIGTVFDAKLAAADVGFSYLLTYDFGTATDSDTSRTLSRLQIYEDGRALGPAHTVLDEIRNLGGGRFRHWTDGLHFSASDNSDPRTNGRVYTYEIFNLSDLVITGISWSPSNPAPGQAVTFSATVKNIGQGPTIAGTIIGIGFNLDSEAISWSDNIKTSLLPGASVTLTANGGPSGSSVWMATSGTHIIGGSLDDVFRIPESDETNNRSSTTITVP